MDVTIRIIQRLDENTEIGWWNANRRRVNEVIDAFNALQETEHPSFHRAKIVLARVQSLRQWNTPAGDGSLSDWQLEILDDIESDVRREFDL